MKLGRVGLCVWASFLVGCDHVTKAAAVHWLAPRGPVALLRGLVELRSAENRDIAFSLTRVFASAAKPFVLAAVGVALIAAMLTWAWRRRLVMTGLEQLGVVCVVAGALGNLVDRLLRGYVVDFVWVRHYSIFNVADVLIVAGAAAVLWATRRAPRRPARPV